MNLALTRYGSTPRGTFGEMAMGPFRFQTVERPWLNNQGFVSCVPSGLYSLEPHPSDKFGPTWALVNHDLGVYHWQDEDAKRYAILIHAANYASQLAGCIGLGRYLGVVAHEWAITDSAKSMRDLRRFLNKGPEPQGHHNINIRWAQPEENTNE